MLTVPVSGGIAVGFHARVYICVIPNAASLSSLQHLLALYSPPVPDRSVSGTSGSALAAWESLVAKKIFNVDNVFHDVEPINNSIHLD